VASKIKLTSTFFKMTPGWILLLLLVFHSCQTQEDDQSPQLTTDAVTSLEDGSYQISGTLTLMGTGEITQHGICWGETALPDINGPSTQLGSLNSKGTFSSIVAGLDENKTYHVRAYVVTKSVPIYANEKTFIAEQDSENRVTDVDGNIYRTVKIGEQTWMAENMKATKYADGTLIPHLADHDEWYDMTRESVAYCWYDNLLALGYKHGALYTWKAAVNGQDSTDLNPSEVQGVCPDGWHVPSDSEWKQLELFLGMDEEELDKEDWRGAGVGGKLKQAGTSDWLIPNAGATGETGFNALPGGFRHGSAEFIGTNTTARFWTTTKPGYSYGWYRQLDYDNSAINRNFEGVYRGHSVRCVKDD
jgi:uncharacterized protein (TIGR02145 family)